MGDKSGPGLPGCDDILLLGCCVPEPCWKLNHTESIGLDNEVEWENGSV